MGTTSEKLTYLNETKQELKQAINNLGGDITSQTTFRQYVDQLDNVYDNLPKTSFQEGTSVTLEGLKGKIDFDTQDGKKVVGYGDTEQNGEPSPTNEVPIQCVTGEQSIVESGKNLLDSDKYEISATNNGITATKGTGGKIILNGTASANSFVNIMSRGNARHLEAGTYTLSANNPVATGGTSGQNVIRLIYGTSGDVVSGSVVTMNTINASATFTLSEPLDVYLMARTQNGNTYSNFELCPQLEQGSTATTYEPYHTPITYPISLGNNKFYSIGDYADELLYDVENDKVYKKAYIEEIHLTKNINWIGQVFNNVYRVNTDAYTDILLPLSESTSSYVKSNMYIAGWATVFGRLRSGYIGIYTNSNIYICTHFTTSNMQGWKDFLDANDVVVVAPRKEPLLTELTDTTLHQQVKNWYYAKSYNGTTIIESNGDLPMIIKIRALKGE